MTAILCRSALLAQELSAIIGAIDTLVFGSGNQTTASAVPWLLECLRKNPVNLVIYEPCFFVDPSPFRLASPGTCFVVLAAPGEEEDARTALQCGTSAVIDKPVVAQDVRGVLSLVSQ